MGEQFMDMIAEQELVATFSDGSSTTVCLRLGRPRPLPRADWVCPVQLAGLPDWEASKDVFGVTSWQAMVLGLTLLHSCLGIERNRGTTFSWLGMELTDFEELIPKMIS
jgi:hypothetical protein